MTKSGELNTFDMWQDLLQGVKGNFQESRALAPAEQKHLGAHAPETLQLPTHIDDELKVIVQRWSERPHRYVAARSFLILALHRHADKQLEQPAGHDVEDRRPHLRSFHAGDKRCSHLTLGYLLVIARQNSSRRRRVVNEERRFEDGGFMNGGQAECCLKTDDAS